MINKSAHLIFFALILLSLSACLPQVELEQPAHPVDTATPPSPLATPPSPLATPPSPLATPPLATPHSPLATPHSPPATPSPMPLPAEELIMPVEPTAQPPVPVEQEPTDPPADQQSNPPPSGPTPQPGVQTWIDQAKEDLAQRLNISTSEIELISFESKVWPDGALGCPKPGMNYIQVLVEGYLIRLRAGDQIYSYHGGGSGAPFLCQQPQSKFYVPDPPDKQAPPPFLTDQ